MLSQSLGRRIKSESSEVIYTFFINMCVAGIDAEFRANNLKCAPARTEKCCVMHSENSAHCTASSQGSAASREEPSMQRQAY